jgi:hypothetical protein
VPQDESRAKDIWFNEYYLNDTCYPWALWAAINNQANLSSNIVSPEFQSLWILQIIRGLHRTRGLDLRLIYVLGMIAKVLNNSHGCEEYKEVIVKLTLIFP